MASQENVFVTGSRYGILPYLFVLIANQVEAAPVLYPTVEKTKSTTWPTWLDVGGSHRTRFSYLHNQFRPGLDRQDQALSLRSLLKIGIRLGSVSIVGELQDSRAYFTDNNSAISTTIVNALEPTQAYINLRLGVTNTLDLRLGRQSIDLGSRRLVARYRNAIITHNGLSIDYNFWEHSRFFIFAVLPARVRPSNSDQSALVNNQISLDYESLDLIFLGGFLELWFNKYVALETYFYSLIEDDSKHFETSNRQIHTPGFRLYKKKTRGSWDFDIETAFQFGQRRVSKDPFDTRDLDVKSNFQHVSLGYTMDVRLSPRLGVEADYGSGDAPSTKSTYERFDSLFGPRRADFGPAGIYGPLGRENIISAGLRLSFQYKKRWDGFISWRANWLANSHDVFARTSVGDPSGQSGNFGAHEVEFRSRFWLIPAFLRWEFGGSVLLRGEFLETAPMSPDFGHPLFFYSDMKIFF